MICSIRARVSAPHVFYLATKSLECLLNCWTAFSLFAQALLLQAFFVFFAKRFVAGARIFDMDANAGFLSGGFTAGVSQKLRILGFGKCIAQVTRLWRELDVQFTVFQHRCLRRIKRRDEQHLLLTL